MIFDSVRIRPLLGPILGGIGGASILAVCVLALGATASCRSLRVQHEARAFADAYFATLRDGGFDGASPLYAVDFFERTPRESWRDSRALVDATLGAISGFRMEKWTMEVLPNGTFVTFEYEVTYTRGASRDTLTVVLPVGEETFRIYGHRVHSPALSGPATPQG